MTAKPLQTCGPHTAFECPKCGKRYGDDHYHGPWPHTPANICLDCWAVEWVLIQVRMKAEQNWTELDEALFLVSQGFTQSEAAGFIGKHRNTLGNWIRKLRRFPHLVPDWLVQNKASRVRTGKRGHHVR